MPDINKECVTIGSLLQITNYDTTIQEASETIYIRFSNLKAKYLLANAKREEESILLLDLNGNVICEFKAGQTLTNTFNGLDKPSNIIEPLLEFLAQR